jgi:hypothetical protein
MPSFIWYSDRAERRESSLERRVLSQKSARIGDREREKLQESRRVNGRPGLPVLSKDGQDLKTTLEGLGSGIRVFPNTPGAKHSDPWACHVNRLPTGFQTCFRINGQAEECITVLVLQDPALRKRVEGAINAWWQALLPSDIISPDA